jgi:hypothetical protein
MRQSPESKNLEADGIAKSQVVLVDRFGSTHPGEFLGRPSTGDGIEWMAIHIYTIRGGRFNAATQARNAIGAFVIEPGEDG